MAAVCCASLAPTAVRSSGQLVAGSVFEDSEPYLGCVHRMHLNWQAQRTAAATRPPKSSHRTPPSSCIRRTVKRSTASRSWRAPSGTPLEPRLTVERNSIRLTQLGRLHNCSIGMQRAVQVFHLRRYQRQARHHGAAHDRLSHSAAKARAAEPTSAGHPRGQLLVGARNLLVTGLEFVDANAGIGAPTRLVNLPYSPATDQLTLGALSGNRFDMIIRSGPA